MQSGAHGCRRYAEHAGCLTPLESLPHDQRNQLAIYPGELPQGRVDGAVRGSQLRGVPGEVQAQLLPQAHAESIAAFLPPPMVRQDAAGHAIQPQARLASGTSGSLRQAMSMVSAVTSAASSAEVVRRSAYPRTSRKFSWYRARYAASRAWAAGPLTTSTP
jgi:hypothetical protein